jgi:hypothetical protein
MLCPQDACPAQWACQEFCVWHGVTSTASGRGVEKITRSSRSRSGLPGGACLRHERSNRTSLWHGPVGQSVGHSHYTPRPTQTLGTDITGEVTTNTLPDPPGSSAALEQSKLPIWRTDRPKGAPEELRRREPILRRLGGRGEVAAEFCQSQHNAVDRIEPACPEPRNAGSTAITPRRADKPAASYVDRRLCIQ